MGRSTPMELPELVCLVCGISLNRPRLYDGSGHYLPALPTWRKPRYLGVRGMTCKLCDPALDEPDPHLAIIHFDAWTERLMGEANPDAQRICLEVMDKSHSDYDGQWPTVKVRIDRAELKVRGQNEFHTWRQATWAWHVRAHGIEESRTERFAWITEGYVFPEVSRPIDQRYVDGNLLPRYPDGSPYAGPEDPKKHEAWLQQMGAYSIRRLEEAKLVE